METLLDHDPLRHDIGYNPDYDATRDSMPTLQDIDPLKYDLEAPDSVDLEVEVDIDVEEAAEEI